MTGSGSGVEVCVYFDGGPDGEVDCEESTEEMEPVRERLGMMIMVVTSCSLQITIQSQQRPPACAQTLVLNSPLRLAYGLAERGG